MDKEALKTGHGIFPEVQVCAYSGRDTTNADYKLDKVNGADKRNEK
jgi:hypothetical protein